MSLVKEKAESILRAIEQVSAQVHQDCTVEYQDEDNALIYGPFPSFLIAVSGVGVPRVIIHVNSDAPNMVWFFLNLTKEFELVIDGAFAVDGQTGEILLGHAAYTKKEDNILLFADEIVSRRGGKQKEPEIIVPEKKIILGV